jgi:cob(I)alamin adenosyltransferase
MKKSKIYTKTGDSGETGLVSGNRIIKSDLRIDLYGELDELNSRVGFTCSLLHQYQNELRFLQMIQSALFDLGSNMACEFENRTKFNLPQLDLKLIEALEQQIDIMDKELPVLKNFILPGGSLVVSSIHLARTCTRTVERKLIHYQHLTSEELPVLSIVFLNRLSDYLFVLARHINYSEGGKEITWSART